MATLIEPEDPKFEAEADVELLFAIDSKYDQGSLKLVGAGDWKIEALPGDGEDTYGAIVTGKMPSAPVKFVITATFDDELYKSAEFTVNVAEPGPQPSGGGGGCSTGFAGLALLLAAPLFFRKKD